MPNWSTNHTVFIGSAATLDTIEAAVSDAQFDFDKLRPRPEVYSTYTSPARIVSDEAFTERYGLDAPHTIDEFIETHKLHNSPPSTPRARKTVQPDPRNCLRIYPRNLRSARLV